MGVGPDRSADEVHAKLEHFRDLKDRLESLERSLAQSPGLIQTGLRRFVERLTRSGAPIFPLGGFKHHLFGNFEVGFPLVERYLKGIYRGAVYFGCTDVLNDCLEITSYNAVFSLLVSLLKAPTCSLSIGLYADANPIGHNYAQMEFWPCSMRTQTT